jgi:AmiR/NasT family two-component response regulator
MSTGNQRVRSLNGSVPQAPDVPSQSEEIDQLRTALEHRNLIGQAQGIVMGRLDVDADQAFEYLRRVSMHTNRKVVDIAEEIAAKRKLFDLR